MNLLDSISEIMSTNLVTLPIGSTVADAAKIFDIKRMHHIPITDEGRLVGMVSKSDYLLFKRGFLKNEEEERAEMERMKNTTIDSIMTKGVARLHPHQKINVALEIFKENIFHAIPIIDEDKLVGIVTTYDILNRLAIDNGAVAQYQ